MENFDHFPSFNSVGDVFYWLVAKKAIIGSVEIKYHFEKIQLCSREPTNPGIVARDTNGFVETQEVEIAMTYGPLNSFKPVYTGFKQLELSLIETDISTVMDIKIAHFVEIVFDVRIVII